LNQTVTEISSVRAQVKDWAERAGVEQVTAKADAIVEKLDEISKALSNPEANTARSLPGGLDATLGGLPPQIANADRQPTAGQAEASAKVMADVDAQLAAYQEVKAEDIAEFNALIA